MSTSINEQLIQSVIDNDASKVKELLSAGADINYQESKSQGFSSLHFAAQNQNAEITQILLGNGATVDLENVHGNTPLFVATFNSKGEGSVIKVLLGAKADPNHTNKAGQSPVGLAKLIGNYDVAQFFAE